MQSVRQMRRCSGKHSKIATHIKRLDNALELTVRYAESVDKRLVEKANLFGGASLLTEEEQRALSLAQAILCALRYARIRLNSDS